MIQKNLSQRPFFHVKDLGLPETGFVFCCFNNSYKFTPPTFDSWCRILKEVDGSVLLIFAANDKAKINLTKEIVEEVFSLIELFLESACLNLNI